MLPQNKETVLLGAGLDSEAAIALKALCDNRELLIAVAKAAHRILGIEPTPVPGCRFFESTAASLKGELAQGGRAKKGKAAADRPKEGAKGEAPAEEPDPDETASAADKEQN